jgi:hypothetical protein
MSDRAEEAARERHRRVSARSAGRGRRRNTLVLWLVALGVMIAATAAFVIPMLITP